MCPMTTTYLKPAYAIRARPYLGYLSIAALAVASWMALLGSPRDAVMGDVVRVLYVLRPDLSPTLDPSMLAALVAMVVAFTILYAYLMVSRVRIERARQARVLAARG